MARRDDRSNTTPSTPDLAANPPERQTSRGGSRARRGGEDLDTQPNTTETGTLGALGPEPPGPLGTELLGPGPIGSGAMGPGPVGTGAMGDQRSNETFGAGGMNAGFSERPAGAPGQEQGDQGRQDVKQEVRFLASEAKQQTARVAGQAKSQVNQLVAKQKDQMAERLGSLAGALREAGQKLQEREAEGYGQYADRAAAQVDRVSDYLRRQDLTAFVHDLEGFARRHPDVFLGGALIAGVLLARFLKSSAEPEPWEEYPASAYATPPYERYGEGYGSARRYGAGTGIYGPSYGTGGL